MNSMHKTMNHLLRRQLSATNQLAANLFLVWLVLVFFCPPVFAASSGNYADQPFPNSNSPQWQINQENNQEKSKQRQELYRVRLAVPGTDNPFAPQDPSAKLIKRKPTLPPPSTIADNPLTMIPFTGMVLLAGYLCARKFTPQIFPSAWLNADPFGEDATSEEQKLLKEFVESFRARFTTTAKETTTATDATPAPENPHRMFYSQAKERLVNMRRWLDDLRRGPDNAAQRNALANLCCEFGALKIDAHFPEVLPAYQLATAAQGLLKQLLQKPNRFTQSTARTIGGSLEMLEKLCLTEAKPDLLAAQPLKFLVADDESITRHAMSVAIDKAFSKPDLAEDGLSALARANEQTYDAIFLDVNMPGMDGFELCSKIRTSERNHATPIIFVTNNSDFDSRAQSVLIGGNDLMGKPFLIFEIALKALTHAFEARFKTNGERTVSKTGPDKPDADLAAPTTKLQDNGNPSSP
jgi:CheY-like chemotaxis protein